MWKRFASQLACVQCLGPLDLVEIVSHTATLSPEHRAQGEKLGIAPTDLESRIEDGLLVCPACKLWYPISRHLPVMLPYATPLHNEFRARHSGEVEALGPEYRLPADEPAPGEFFVQRSFSHEWLDYSYDGVLWTWSYEDRRALFYAEIGRNLPPLPARFLEIGCGLGLVTSFAQDRLEGDAVGVDLSLAALRAAGHFADNPFLHFVQASLWKLPFSERAFDVVYSHGVLHHTFSTHRAIEAIAPRVAPGGLLYVWVYGTGSITESLARRVAYGVEICVRPILARLPAPLTNAILAPAALGYIAINKFQRLAGSPRHAYDYSRALHAARDRLTPLYAERVAVEKLEHWFADLGFEHIESLTALEVPEATRETIRRNSGVRGRRK